MTSNVDGKPAPVSEIGAAAPGDQVPEERTNASDPPIPTASPTPVLGGSRVIGKRRV
jgi:hypothetical protein